MCNHSVQFVNNKSNVTWSFIRFSRSQQKCPQHHYVFIDSAGKLEPIQNHKVTVHRHLKQIQWQVNSFDKTYWWIAYSLLLPFHSWERLMVPSWSELHVGIDWLHAGLYAGNWAMCCTRRCCTKTSTYSHSKQFNTYFRLQFGEQSFAYRRIYHISSITYDQNLHIKSNSESNSMNIATLKRIKGMRLRYALVLLCNQLNVHA